MLEATTAGVATAALTRLSALLAVAILLFTLPASANESGAPDRREQEDGQRLYVQTQGVCSDVLPSGKIVYFSCDKRPTQTCSTVTSDGDIVYFLCKRLHTLQ